MADPNTYHLPEYVRFSRIDDDRAVLSAPIEKHLLEGNSVKLVAEAIPLLREGTTAAEIADELKIHMTTAEQLLAQLSETDVISHHADIEGDFLKWVSSRSGDAQAELAEYTVAALAPAEIPIEPPESLSSSVDISIVDSPSTLAIDTDSPNLVVTIAVGEAPEFHRAVLNRTWSNNVPWLPVRLVDSMIKLGPYSPPETDACYNCYYNRLIASAVDREIAKFEHQQYGHQLFPDVIESLMWSLTHFELASIVAPERQPSASGAVVAVDPLNMNTTTTDVLKLPGCEVCGTN